MRYTKAFSKTKRRVFRYPKFNDVDYPPEVLREAYNALARVCDNFERKRVRERRRDEMADKRDKWRPP